MTAEKKIALITGILGQDGHYLSHLLVKKGYKVHGLVRRTSNPNPNEKYLPQGVELHDGDMTDFSSILSVISKVRPDEVYNLAAQSFVGASFNQPAYTTAVNTLGFYHLLEAIREQKPARVYQASTSEMFGGISSKPANEETPFHPRSPYGISKVAAHYTAQYYREAFDMFVCSGILHNHESPMRGPQFVTRKISMAVAKIKKGLQNKLALGNLDAKRDWGFAGDYVEAMWLMLQQDIPDTYVLATGETHSVREFCEAAFSHVGLDYHDFVVVDPQYYRPCEVEVLCGDASKAYNRLGWSPTTTFEQLAKEMVDYDLRLLDQ